MTTSVTRPCFTSQHQTCKSKTKTDFFWSQTGLVLRPTVSNHITGIVVACLTSRKPFSFVADPDQDTDPGIFLRNFYRCGIGPVVRISGNQLSRQRFAVSKCPLLYSLSLQCFDSVGWAAGRQLACKNLTSVIAKGSLGNFWP